jgi:hypothetical protein
LLENLEGPVALEHPVPENNVEMLIFTKKFRENFRTMTRKQ